MRSLMLCLALAISAPSLAQDEEETTEEEAPEPLTEEEITELFAGYEESMKRGQKAQAADALLPIFDDEAAAEVHGDAWLKMAELLVSFDMEYSALVAYANGIEADPDKGAAYVAKALEIADKTSDAAILGPVLAKNLGMKVDKNTRSSMAYLASRHYFSEDRYGIALGLLKMVTKDSDAFVDSEALRGVLLSQQGRYNDALAPLLTAQQLGMTKGKSERFRAVMQMNVARAYYAAGNHPRAMKAYSDVSRASNYWLDATYERAWAHFQITDMAGSVALLMNTGAPFFDDWYFPEADLLRTYSLFMMCKFPDASVEIQAFIDTYTPIKEELAKLAPTLTPEMGFDAGVAYINDKPTAMPGMIIRKFKTDDRFLDAIGSIDRAHEEVARLEGISANPFAAKAAKSLSDRADAIRTEQGQRVVDRVTGALAQLKDFLSNVQVTKLDIMQMETNLLEQAGRTGTLDYGDKIGELRKMRKKANARVWPFQGEYWADELGYYQVTARPDCPEKMMVGKK